MYEYKIPYFLTRDIKPSEGNKKYVAALEAY